MKEFGVIKWFHDKANDKKYGFIEHPKYDSLFFHKNSISSGISDKDLDKNTVVSFEAVPSEKKKGDWEAKNVSLFDIETDSEAVIKLYFDSFLDNYLQEHFPQYLEGFHLKAKIILQQFQDTNSIHSYYQIFEEAFKRNFENAEVISLSQVERVLKIGLVFFPDFSKTTFDFFLSKISMEEHFFIWQKKLTDVFPFKYFLKSKALLNLPLFAPLAKQSTISAIVELSILQLEEFVDANQEGNYLNIKKTLQNSKSLLNQNFKEVLDAISFRFYPQIEWQLWKDEVIENCKTKSILDNYNPLDIELTEFCLKHSTKEQREELIPFLHQSIIKEFSEGNISFEKLSSLYLKIQDFFEDYIISDFLLQVKGVFKYSEQISLWLSNIFPVIPIDAIVQEILIIDSDLFQQITFKANTEEINEIIDSIFQNKWGEIQEDELVQIIEKIGYALRKKQGKVKEELVGKIYSRSNDSLRLKLWLIDFHETLEFGAFKHYVITLPNVSQRTFLKKVLNYIHTGRANISVAELTSLNVIDYETAKLAESIDGVGLDYSISILLNTIKDLNQQDQGKNQYEIKKQLFEIILNQLKDPKDVLEITGFFDECEGRSSLGKPYQENINGESVTRYPVIRDEEKKPLNHQVCDGRHAREKESGKPALDEVSGLQFWWCANQKCFEPSRYLRSSDYWRGYAIQDFLNVLKVQYKESDLEVYLSLINKTNRFLKHLKCRSCDHILHPIGQTNYAIYGVNNFHCTNENCEEVGKEIYLTHCLNGRCDGTIDSRDSVKCKPDGYSQEGCGWYVCNDCHACCSTEKLNGRKYVAEAINKVEYKCHHTGHVNQGQICCNKCGSAMTAHKPDMQEFNRILNWFISHKDTSNLIVQSGQNRFGKWWFRLKAKDGDTQSFYSKLLKYKRLGFNVPDLSEGVEYQLVAEPLKFGQERVNELECENCGHNIDLNEFPEKRSIMKGYHENILL